MTTIASALGGTLEATANKLGDAAGSLHDSGLAATLADAGGNLGSAVGGVAGDVADRLRDLTPELTALVPTPFAPQRPSRAKRGGLALLALAALGAVGYAVYRRNSAKAGQATENPRGQATGPTAPMSHRVSDAPVAKATPTLAAGETPGDPPDPTGQPVGQRAGQPAAPTD
jgi:hypothetical protein